MLSKAVATSSATDSIYLSSIGFVRLLKEDNIWVTVDLFGVKPYCLLKILPFFVAEFRARKTENIKNDFSNIVQ